MSSISVSICCCLLGFSTYKVIKLVGYVRLARATGLKYVVTPFLETEVIAFLLTPILRYIYHEHLDRGAGWPRWCRFIIKDWSWEDKRLAFDEYGDVFLCVSPEGIICYSSDATMAWDVMNRRNDFTKPPDKYKLLEPYGPNVATAEGATYRFHVRITAPPFGDLNGANELVWEETIKQTRRLCEVQSRGGPRELNMDVNALTLAVISRAGFGKQTDWTRSKEHEENIPAGYKMSFLKAISDTTGYMVTILVFPGWLLSLTPLKKAHTAQKQLEQYLREMIREERQRIEQNADYQCLTARGNLLTAVMRASFNEAKSNAQYSNITRKEAFTEDEVMGNLFIYLLAGYETTANAISYGLIALALCEDIQEEVIREVDAVHAHAVAVGRNELSYLHDFDRLRYTYGFMYEIFRLFPGVTLITKMAKKYEEIKVTKAAETNTILLPPGTRVYLSAPGVHYHPNYWPDPYKLDPQRWMAPAKHLSSIVDEKRVVAADKTRHMRGTLLTFSDGARACLGRKFAQAEYIAFLTALLRDYRVVLADGQDKEVVRRDIFLKCAGKVTLAPVEHVKIGLKKR